MPWNQPLKKKTEPKKVFPFKPLFIIVGCIVIGVLASILLNTSTENTDSATQKTPTKKISVKSKPRKSPRTNTITKTSTNIANAVAEKPKEMWMGHEIKSTTIKTNGTDLIITRIDVNGKKHKEYTSIQKRLFTNPVDIVLAILLTAPEGAPTPPIPSLGPRSDELFISALKKPIALCFSRNWDMIQATLEVVITIKKLSSLTISPLYFTQLMPQESFFPTVALKCCTR